jgi:hypothetical protein
MQPKIPPSLEARLQPHLQRVRDGVGGDDDMLPTVFAILLERQQELELATGNSAVNLDSTVKEVARVSGRHFELLLMRQKELERVASNTATEVGNVRKAIDAIAERQSAIETRLEVLQSVVIKRATVALTIQVIGLVVLMSAIAFLMFRR